MRSSAVVLRGWVWWRSAAVGLATAALVGVPTDVIDTPLFTRMTPVRGWEYPLLVATTLLAAIWAGLPGRVGGVAGVSGSGVLGTLAAGCPVCNKLVVALLGVSGAFGIWAPIQPLLAIVSVLALGAAVVLRWRRAAPDSCPVPDPAPSGKPESNSVDSLR